MVAGSAAWTRSRQPPSSSPRTATTVTQPAVRRHRRFRRRRPGIHRRAGALRRQGGRRPGGVGQRRLRVPERSMRRRRCIPACGGRANCAAKQGLYEVVEGIYQVRGLDLSNISFIEGDTGVIVIDPLISTETAAAALALYRDAPRRPAGRRRHLHPQPRRPLRRRARRDDAGGRRRGQGRDHRARTLHRTRRAGERLRGHRDGAAGGLHVRRGAGARTAGPGGLRAGSDAVDRAKWR